MDYTQSQDGMKIAMQSMPDPNKPGHIIIVLLLEFVNNEGKTGHLQVFIPDEEWLGLANAVHNEIVDAINNFDMHFTKEKAQC